MALTGLHTNWGSGSYLNDRDGFIKDRENYRLAHGTSFSGLRPHFDGRDDGKGSIAIGYGFDLLVNDNTTINNSLTEANGRATTLTAADIALLAQARARRIAGTATPSYLRGVASQLSVSLDSEPAATTLLDSRLIQYEAALDGALGGFGQLASSKERRTVILIAHRLSTLRIAERIIVLEKGEIVESGSHDELMVKKGLYHHLQLQQNVELRM